MGGGSDAAHPGGEVRVRIGLRTDWGAVPCRPEPGEFSVPAGLDQDVGCPCGGGCGCDPAAPTDRGLPTLTVRERTRRFYDTDGNPRYEWATVAEGEALLFETRQETNDATGQTLVSASAAIGWAGGVAPKETAVVLDSRGHRWEVVACDPLPGRLQLRLQWIDDAP